jgi:hypothetical protein
MAGDKDKAVQTQQKVWFRMQAETGSAEIQVADDGWTNPRWQRAEFRYIEPGELLVWHFQQLQPALSKRNPARSSSGARAPANPCILPHLGWE